MPDDEPRPHPLRWWWLAGALLGVATVAVAATAPSSAFPVIAQDLELSRGTLQWVAGATALGIAVMVVPGVVLGDLLGHARVFLLGTAGFILASTLGAVAGGGGELIAARLVQGLAAGLILPQVIGYARAYLSRVERAVACGLFGFAFVAGAAVGPALGAELTDAASWRAVFWVLLPAGVLLAVAAVPVALARHELRVDPRALLLAAAAVPAAAAIMYPLTARDVAAWPAWYLLPLVAGCLLLAGCLALEVVRRGVPGGLGAPLVALLVVAAAAPHLSTVQVYAQVTGLSSDSVRHALLPVAGGAMVGAALAIVLARRVNASIAAALGAGIIALGGVVHLASLDATSITEGVLAVTAAATGMGLVLVLAGVVQWDLSARPGSTPAAVFAAIALGTPAGALLYRLLVPPSAVVEGPDAFHDATVRVLVVTIAMLVAAAGVALGIGLARPRQPRTDLTSRPLEDVTSGQ